MRTSLPSLRLLALFLASPSLALHAGCEQPLDIIVSVTNLPPQSEGLEFLVRTLAIPTGGQDAVQTAADTPAQRLQFGEDVIPQVGTPYTFGLRLSSEPRFGKVQVNVAALSRGCPIAVGVGEINPPLTLQNLPVDLRPAPGTGSANPAVGCAPGQPQIFAVVRTRTRINLQVESFRVALSGWGFYPDSLVLLAYDPLPGNPDPLFPLPLPKPVSKSASEVYGDYRLEDLPVSQEELEKGFTGESSIKITVANPDKQRSSVLLSSLK